MKQAELVLSGVAAVLAIIAAVFWFASAHGEIPDLVTYWGRAPKDDPLIRNFQMSAQMNTYAASFSGASALSWAASTACAIWGNVRRLGSGPGTT
jgi:hypothetical protein